MFANMASHSVEVTEAEHPIQLLAYEFVPDKAGAGKPSSPVCSRFCRTSRAACLAWMTGG